MISAAKVAELRRDFPITENYIYFNNAGVGPTSVSVKDAVDEFFRKFLQRAVLDEEEWEERAEVVRGKFAQLVGASADEITFVRNTSHGLSLFSSGWDWKEGDNIAVALGEEYPSNVYPWEQVALQGVEVRFVEVTADRRIPIDHFRQVVDENTRTIAVSSVQYASGFRAPLADLGQLAEEVGAFLIVDGIQSVGALKTDVKELGIHLLSADSHKWILGFPGIGACYIDKALASRLTPPLVGWKSTKEAWDFDRAHYDLVEDARRFEEGSPNYPSIYGLGAALDILLDLGIEEIEKRLLNLTDYLAAQLEEQGFQVLSSRREGEKSSVLCFGSDLAQKEAILDEISAQNIVISLRRGSFRISPHFYNTREEIDEFLNFMRKWSSL